MQDCVSTLWSFLSSRRYRRAYVWPSETSKDSILDLDWRSTFLMRLSSSEVMRPARW